jgi:hypothetical protein
MLVPQAETAPADEPDDLYGLAEDSLPAAAVARPMPAPAVATATTSQPISYRSAPTKENTKQDRFSFGAMTHPPRDFYIPTALVIVGIFGIIGWAVHLGAGPVMVAIVSLAAGFATLVKTAVLIGLAFIVAPMMGISFGDVRTAILKFAAIVIFTDTIGLWYDEIVEMAGGYPSGRTGGRIFWLQVLLISFVITYLAYYLFDMDGDDAGKFGLPFAIASQVMGFVMWVVLMAVIEGMLAGAAATKTPAPAAPVPAAAPGTPVAPAAAPGITPQVTDRDREIDRSVAGGRMTDAVEFNSTARDRDKREPQLVNQFYGFGAKRVYFGPKGIIVQLPDDVANRAKCFQLAAAHRTAKGIEGPAPTEQGQRYLEFELDDKPARPRDR